MGGQNLAILGGGHMGRALIGGLLRRGMRAEDIRVAEVSGETRAELARDFAVRTAPDATALIADADLVLIAVKPHEVQALLAPLAGTLAATRPLILSVAAGIRIASLQMWCGAKIPVMRAMPNRPALIGAGVSALYADAGMSEAARETAVRVMSAVGEVVWVATEESLDVVTALSGSGPAYFFLLAERMAEAAVRLGLDAAAARTLAVGTLYGAGLLAHTGDQDLARLRCEVTSKGGTTQAALEVFAAADLAGTVMKALEAASRRSFEMAREFG